MSQLDINSLMPGDMLLSPDGATVFAVYNGGSGIICRAFWIGEVGNMPTHYYLVPAGARSYTDMADSAVEMLHTHRGYNVPLRESIRANAILTYSLVSPIKSNPIVEGSLLNNILI